MNDHDDETTTHRTRTNRRPTSEDIADANIVEAVSNARVPEDVSLFPIGTTRKGNPKPSDLTLSPTERERIRQHISTRKEGER